jgi:hypothetical protein
MRRAFLLVATYAAVGTLLTLVVYRLLLGAPLSPAGADSPLDGIVAFIGITLNLLLAFAAAGVAAVMIRSSHASFALVIGISAVVAGAVGIGMMFWFAGLSLSFPVTMIGTACVCATVAKFAGLLEAPAN